VRSTTAPYTESRLTRSVANERVGFPVVEQFLTRIISFQMLWRGRREKCWASSAVNWTGGSLQ